MAGRSLPCVIADIGGTHARFATVQDDKLTNIEVYNDRDYATLPLALNHYWQSIGAPKLKAAALAVAGPVLGDRVPLTNCDWVCDRAEIGSLLSVERVLILNDFEALAHAVGVLNDEVLDVIQSARPLEARPKLILGPGTGLGVAALKPANYGGYEAVTTEAGHTRYAAANEREAVLIRYLGHETGFVSAENLLSGPGLIHLYRAQCHLSGHDSTDLSAPEIVSRARNGDAVCVAVTDIFSTMLGGFTSQMTLSMLALGGVYLTGGVLDKMEGLFNRKLFLERFLENPKMSYLLRQVPIYHVLKEVPAFDGLRAVL